MIKIGDEIDTARGKIHISVKMSSVDCATLNNFRYVMALDSGERLYCRDGKYALLPATPVNGYDGSTTTIQKKEPKIEKEPEKVPEFTAMKGQQMSLMDFL